MNKSPTRLLVVDDEEDLELLIRQRFRRHIRQGELDFVFAHNGKEAIEKLAERPPRSGSCCRTSTCRSWTASRC